MTTTSEDHNAAQPGGIASSEGLGPLPDTRYVCGTLGDGYSEDRCSSWPAWDEDAMEAERKRCYALGVAAERERWQTAARLVLEATPEQMPLALDVLRDVYEA